MLDAMPPTTYRPDGFPYCPSCHQDELYSLMPAHRWENRTPLERLHRYPFACYCCRWRGWVEPDDGIR